MNAPQGYTVDAVQYWLDGERKWNSRRKQKAAHKSAALMMEWYENEGYRQFGLIDGSGKRAMYKEARRYVNDRMKPKGFIVGFFLFAMVSGVITWVVHRILDWIMSDEKYRNTFDFSVTKKKKTKKKK